MSVVEEGLEVSEVIVQESIHTFERISEAVAKPIVYMIDRYVVNGFYRIHASHGTDENLNTLGMHFVPLPFASNSLPDSHARPGAGKSNRLYTYGVMARLALLATLLELEKTDPNSLI